MANLSPTQCDSSRGTRRARADGLSPSPRPTRWTFCTRQVNRSSLPNDVARAHPPSPYDTAQAHPPYIREVAPAHLPFPEGVARTDPPSPNPRSTFTFNPRLAHSPSLCSLQNLPWRLASLPKCRSINTLCRRLISFFLIITVPPSTSPAAPLASKPPLHRPSFSIRPSSPSKLRLASQPPLYLPSLSKMPSSPLRLPFVSKPSLLLLPSFSIVLSSLPPCLPQSSFLGQALICSLAGVIVVTTYQNSVLASSSGSLSASEQATSQVKARRAKGVNVGCGLVCGVWCGGEVDIVWRDGLMFMMVGRAVAWDASWCEV